MLIKLLGFFSSDITLWAAIVGVSCKTADEHCCCSPENQLYRGLHPKQCSHQSKKGASIPLSWDPIWSTASSSGVLRTGRTWTCESREGPPRWSQEPNTSPRMKAWKSWNCSTLKRESSGETLLWLFSTWRGLIRRMETVFLACCNRTRGNYFKLKEGRFRLDIRQKVYIMKVLKHCNKLPREGAPQPW